MDVDEATGTPLSGFHDGRDGDETCGRRPHHHVSLGGTVTHRPTLFQAPISVCEVRAVFDEGVGDAAPMCFSVIVMGPEAKTCQKWLETGVRVEFEGVLVHFDVRGPGGLLFRTYCGMGDLGLRPATPTAASRDDDASVVPLAQVALVLECPDSRGALTMDAVRFAIRTTLAELQDVIVGPGSLPPISV